MVVVVVVVVVELELELELESILALARVIPDYFRVQLCK